MTSELARAAEQARTWLFEDALPLWAGAGRDAHGFCEKLDLEGAPLPLPRRLIVQARQVYAFAEAGRLGWPGDWREIVETESARLEEWRRPDGGYCFSREPRESGRDDRVDLYSHAFLIFACAHAWRALDRPESLKDRATAALGFLHDRLGHEAAGFHEARPPTSPLRSNPHMHLFEASLAWMAVDPAPEWRALADELDALSGSAFIDPGSGAVREYFDLGWAPARGDLGRTVEPGHQFEWAWLLDRHARLLERPPAAAAGRLKAFGERYGVDRARGVAVNELWLGGGVKDAAARLWPQTERLKAALAQARRDPAGAEAHEAAALEAAVALFRYLETPVRGLWRDRMRSDGGFETEPAPASSLYHLVCGFSELFAYVDI